MKNIGYYFIFIIIIVIIIPLLVVKSCGGGAKRDLLEGVKSDKIKVFFHATKQVKVVGFEDYIRGVVAAEMPASYDTEALKAQAVAARTYAYNKIISGGKGEPEHKGADICTNSAHCQAWISKEQAFNNWPKSKRNMYWDKISWAVRSTAGQMIFYDEKIANPVFHANSGGETENSEDAWSGAPIPYLRAVKSPGEEKSSSFLSKVEVNTDEFIKKFKKGYPDLVIDKKQISKSIKIIDYTAGGRVKDISVGNKTLKGTDLRSLFNLKSTNFTITANPQKVIFTVKGFGHGVGLSQCGANVLAQKGMGYKEILKYYYKGVEIK